MIKLLNIYQHGLINMLCIVIYRSNFPKGTVIKERQENIITQDELEIKLFSLFCNIEMKVYAKKMQLFVGILIVIVNGYCLIVKEEIKIIYYIIYLKKLIST